jgi:hypothetical protein
MKSRQQQSARNKKTQENPPGFFVVCNPQGKAKPFRHLPNNSASYVI